MKFIYLFRNSEVLSQESLLNGKVLVLPGPRSKFTELEMNSIRSFINSGGNVLVMLGEGGEKKFNTNINFLLEEFGIMVNNGKKFKIIFKFLNYSLLKCYFLNVEKFELFKKRFQIYSR